MKKAFVVPMLLVFMVAFISCATFEKNTYRTMYIAGTSYDTGMKVVSKLQSQGQITLAQRLDINKAANVFYVTYQVTVDSFEAWKKAQTQTAKEALVVNLYMLAAKWAIYADYINRIIPGSLPATLEGVNP